MIINKYPKKIIPNVFNPLQNFRNSNHFEDIQLYWVLHLNLENSVSTLFLGF